MKGGKVSAHVLALIRQTLPIMLGLLLIMRAEERFDRELKTCKQTRLRVYF